MAVAIGFMPAAIGLCQQRVPAIAVADTAAPEPDFFVAGARSWFGINQFRTFDYDAHVLTGPPPATGARKRGPVTEVVQVAWRRFAGQPAGWTGRGQATPAALVHGDGDDGAGAQADAEALYSAELFVQEHAGEQDGDAGVEGDQDGGG